MAKSKELIRMKESINEASYKETTFKLGYAVELKLRSEPLLKNEASFVMTIPLTDSRGKNWTIDGYVSLGELDRDELSEVLDGKFRKVIGTAIFNANVIEIRNAKFDFSKFAKWESAMLADKTSLKEISDILRDYINNP